MSLGYTLLQLLIRFIVNSVYGAYLLRSYVGSDSLLLIITYHHHHHHHHRRRHHHHHHYWHGVVALLCLY